MTAHRPRNRDKLVDRLTAGFEAGSVAACPPVVEYSREFQVQAAEELAQLTEESAVVAMMGCDPVIREQAGS
ncbi:hypothetical protein [Tateyamaria pelophila]|uniref:hypothetical protein n=1 Tax=Tateyamaria pelophila TaxID=328415 RepID=UPI001CBDA15A|nr:hypothetical protein [Tateyamaria pelophila]